MRIFLFVLRVGWTYALAKKAAITWQVKLRFYNDQGEIKIYIKVRIAHQVFK